MLHNISKINGIKLLNKSLQRDIKGGFRFDGEYGQCLTPNSLFCGVPDHICCNGFCVLPSHAACNF